MENNVEEMYKELLPLALKYQELLFQLPLKTRVGLMIEYFRQNPVDSRLPKYIQVAEIYDKAPDFKVTSILKVIEAVMDMKRDNASMQVTYAKNKGFITKRIKTTQGKGYLQKNYVPKDTKKSEGTE